MSSGCISVPSFDIVDCSVVQGPNPNGITAGIDLLDVVSAQWPFTSAQLNLDGIVSEGLTYADPIARKFSTSWWSRAQTPSSSLPSDWWYYAVGLIASAVVVGGTVAVGFRYTGRRGEEATAEVE